MILYIIEGIRGNKMMVCGGVIILGGEYLG